MVRAMMHGGPRDGEEIVMPWARTEIPFFRFTSDGIDGVDRYQLRGPWRGQEWAHYDYVEPTRPARRRCRWRHQLIRWLWIRWGAVGARDD